MIRVIATDLDGTLLNPKRKFTLIDKKNKNYIKNFYGDLVLVSGRDPKFCAKVCNVLKIEHNFVSLNGAIIVKRGKIVYKQSMKNTILLSLLEYLDGNYDNYEFLIFDKYDKITCTSNIKRFSLRKKYLKHFVNNIKLHQRVTINNKKVEKTLNSNIDIYKAIIYINDGLFEIEAQLRKRFGEHFEFFTSDHSIEISPKGVNKGAALKYLIDSTKVKYNEVLVVGDDSNDISMFEIFPNSFAMNHSPYELKAKAKRTISKFSDLEKYTKMNKNFN